MPILLNHPRAFGLWDNPIISCQEKNKYLAKLAGYNCHLIFGKLPPPAVGLFLAFGEFSQWQIPSFSPVPRSELRGPRSKDGHEVVMCCPVRI